MADYKVTDTELTSIANAIRAKTGKEAQIEFSSEFISEIGSISGGGTGFDELVYNGDFKINTTGQTSWDRSSQSAPPNSSQTIIDGWYAVKMPFVSIESGGLRVASSATGYLLQSVSLPATPSMTNFDLEVYINGIKAETTQNGAVKINDKTVMAVYFYSYSGNVPYLTLEILNSFDMVINSISIKKKMNN